MRPPSAASPSPRISTWRAAGVDLDTLKGLLAVDKELWLEDVKGVEELYAQIGDHVPAELHAEAAALRERLFQIIPSVFKRPRCKSSGGVFVLGKIFENH